MAKYNVTKSLLKANGLQRSGNLSAAKLAYKEILSFYLSNVKAKKALKKIISEEEALSNKHTKFETKLLAMYNSRNYEAIVKLSAGIGITYPSSANIWNIMGASQVALSLFGEAILSFKHSIAANPTCYESLKNLGVCYQTLGNIENAIVLQVRFVAQPSLF